MINRKNAAIVVMWMALSMFPVVCTQFAQARPDDPPRSSAADDSAARLRSGMPPASGRHIHVAMPAQLTLRDVAYWDWLLELDDTVEQRIRGSWERYFQADDAVRRERFVPVFELAALISMPPTDLDPVSAKDLARRLSRERTRAITAMRASEREFFESALLPEIDQPAPAVDAIESDANAELLAQLLAQFDDLRLQDLDQGNSDTLSAAKIDLPRFLYSMDSAIVTHDSREVIRQVALEAQPMLAQLRRAHSSAFNKRLEAECRVKLAAELRKRGGTGLPVETAQQWTRDRDNARKQLAVAARRISEANATLVDSACAVLPLREAAGLRRAYFAEAYGALAASPWDITESAIAMRVALGDAQESTAAELIDAFAEQAFASQREVQRIADRFWQATLQEARPSREKWERSAKQITALHAASRAQFELLIGAFVQELTMEKRDAWDDAITTFRADALERAKAQLEALDSRFNETPKILRHPPPEPSEATAPTNAAK